MLFPVFLSRFHLVACVHSQSIRSLPFTWCDTARLFNGGWCMQCTPTLIIRVNPIKRLGSLPHITSGEFLSTKPVVDGCGKPNT